MKRIVILFICISLIFTLAISANAKTTYKVGDFELEYISNGTALEVDKYIGSSTYAYIIESYNGTYVKSIGEDAFLNCSSIKTVELNDYVDNISSYAFASCSNLEKVIFNLKVANLGNSVFSGCFKLYDINIEDTKIATIPEKAFLNCGLTSIQLPDSCIEIKSKAFMQCSKLGDIFLPRSIVSIATDAFDSSKNVVINCYKDSCAHKYAVENNIKYKLLDDPQPTEPITETETVTQPVTEPVKETYIVGDVNDDKSVTITDATMIQQVIAKLIPSDDRMEQRGDTSFEGSMSVSDVTRIQQFLASIEVDVNHVGKTREYK